MRKRIFISHSKFDSEEAYHICGYLESHGAKCWIAPRDIPPGMDWAEEILQGIDNAGMVLTLKSSNSSRSDHVYRESIYAKQQGKHILEFYLPGVSDGTKERGNAPSKGVMIHCSESLQDGLEQLEIALGKVKLIHGSSKGFLTILKKHKIPILSASVIILLAILLSVSSGNEHKIEWPDSIEFVEIPEGKYLMGSPADENGRGNAEGPLHEVELPAFEIMTTEVTQGMWENIMGEDMRAVYDKVLKWNHDALEPSMGERFPICYVTWSDAAEFADRINTLDTLYHYRLPSEAEWEYACRAGTSGPYNGMDIDSISWNFGNSNGALHEVGGKLPNSWGLYDMHGNVNEWCQDTWHSDYSGAPHDGSAWTDNGSGYRVWRGGGYVNAPIICRAAFRDRKRDDTRDISRGFRLVRTRL